MKVQGLSVHIYGKKYYKYLYKISLSIALYGAALDHEQLDPIIKLEKQSSHADSKVKDQIF